MENSSSTVSKEAAHRLPESLKLTLLVEGNRLRATGRAGEPMPLTQTPPLSVQAGSDLDFALVGDAEDKTYHIFQFNPNNPREMTDLGSTNDRYVSTAPQPPRSVVVILDIKPPKIVPRLEGQTPRKLEMEQLAKRWLSFGIASQCPYWLACNQETHLLHLYQSDMLGCWIDLGSIPDLPC